MVIWALSTMLACSSDDPRLSVENPLPTAETGLPVTDSLPTLETGAPPPPPPPVCSADDCADVLFIVDSSRSMDNIQARLAQSAAGFFEVLDTIDFHVGTISMDLSRAFTAGTLVEGRGTRFVSQLTPDPEGAFREMVQLGVAGSSEEQGIAAAWLMIFVKAEDSTNDGFRRAGAPLHLVFVSNEDDQSDKETVAEAQTAFGALPGGTEVHSLVAFDFQPGLRYLALTDALGGLRESIDSSDYSAFLDQLGLRVVESARAATP